MKFNPALHGLRGAAALLVMIYHWSGPFPGFVQAISDVSFAGVSWNLALPIKMGWLGVDWFFVLSGFVLTGTLWHRRLSVAEVLQFWLRRAARIFPALWVQIILLVLFWYSVGWLASIDWRQVFSNAILWLRPLPGGARSINGVYWTLPVEFSFYLLLPLLFLLYRRTHIMVVIVLAVAFQLFGKFAGYLVPYSDLVYPFWRKVYPFFSGLQLAFVFGIALHTVSWQWPEHQRRIALGLLTFSYFAMMWFMNHHLAEVPRAHWLPLVWRMGMALIIAGMVWLIVQPMRGTGWLDSRPMVWLGEISYGIYLWHLPVQTALARLAPGAFDSPALSMFALALTTGVTLILASLSFYFVERPIIRRFSRRRWTKLAPEARQASLRMRSRYCP